MAGLASTLDATTVIFPRGATRMAGRTRAVVARGQLFVAV